MVRSFALGSQARWLNNKSPGPAKSRSVPSGICITVIDGSGSAPNMSEKTVIERATDAAKSPAFADAERGAYTATLTPSACCGLSCKFPATNVPFGAAFLHSNVYCSRPPSMGFFPATGVGASAFPVPATAKLSGTSR